LKTSIPPTFPTSHSLKQNMFSYFHRSQNLNIIYDDYHFPIVLNADSNGVYAIAKETQDQISLDPVIRQPSIYSRQSSTISLSPNSTIYGIIAPGLHLYTPDWGTFYIHHYAGFKTHNLIRVIAVQPNGQEAELDIPVKWVKLPRVWAVKRWRCFIKRDRYIKEEKPSKDVTEPKTMVSFPSITIMFPNGDNMLARSVSKFSNSF
jgi:hypothetical protein